MKEMEDEIPCKNELKMIIKEIVRDEMESLKRQMDEIKRKIQRVQQGK